MSIIHNFFTLTQSTSFHIKILNEIKMKEFFNMNICKLLCAFLLSSSLLQGVSAMETGVGGEENTVKVLSAVKRQSFSEFIIEGGCKEVKEWPEKISFFIMGHNYLCLSKDSNETAEGNINFNMQDVELTLSQVQKMADDYLQETNIGTILACHLSGEPHNIDSLKRQGVILVGMAQMMRKLEEREALASACVYQSYMYRGVNNILEAMDHLVPFECEKMEDYFLHLIELSRLSSPDPLLGDWSNYAKYLAIQHDKGVLNDEAYHGKIMEEMDRVYNGLISTINSKSFSSPESINDFFVGKIESYIYQILTGTLHFPKDNRSVERAIQETRIAHREMGILTMNLIQKAYPEIMLLNTIYKKAEEVLAKSWIYSALSNSFAGDKELPCLDSSPHVWKEFVFDCETAEEKIKAYNLSLTKVWDEKENKEKISIS